MTKKITLYDKVFTDILSPTTRHTGLDTVSSGYVGILSRHRRPEKSLWFPASTGKTEGGGLRPGKKIINSYSHISLLFYLLN